MCLNIDKMPCWVCLQLKVGLFSFFRLKTVAHFVPIRSMLKMRVQPTHSFILIILRWWKWLQGKEVHLSNLCKFTWDHLISLSPRISWKLCSEWLWNSRIILHSVSLFLISLSLCSVLLQIPPYFMRLGLTAGICSLSLRAEQHSVGVFLIYFISICLNCKQFGVCCLVGRSFLCIFLQFFCIYLIFALSLS